MSSHCSHQFLAENKPNSERRAGRSCQTGEQTDHWQPLASLKVREVKTTWLPSSSGVHLGWISEAMRCTQKGGFLESGAHGQPGPSTPTCLSFLQFFPLEVKTSQFLLGQVRYFLLDCLGSFPHTRIEGAAIDFGGDLVSLFFLEFWGILDSLEPNGDFRYPLSEFSLKVSTPSPQLFFQFHILNDPWK